VRPRWRTDDLDQLDMLTVRENTRRNATSANRPQSQYRPMLNLNRESRKVTFLTRSPTSPRSKRKNKNTTPSALTSTDQADQEEEDNNQGAPTAGPSTDLTGQSLQTQNLSPAAAPQLGDGRPELEQNDGGGDSSPIEEVEGIPSRQTSSPTPSRSASRRAPSPTPSGSLPMHAPSPTSSRDTLKAPIPSRSTRMRTPRTLPDPPSRPPVPPRIANLQPPSPPKIFTSSLVSPGASSSHAHETLATSSASSLVPLVPLPPVAVVAQPWSLYSPASSQTAVSMTSSPLRNSVLPTSRPVIMPRAKKHASLPSPVDSQPSPSSYVSPSLAGSASQYSADSGEPSVRRSYLESLRHLRPTAAGTAGADASRMSTQSSASAYSND